MFAVPYMADYLLSEAEGDGEVERIRAWGVRADAVFTRYSKWCVSGQLFSSAYALPPLRVIHFFWLKPETCGCAP